MTTSNYRGYSIHLIPVGIDWKIQIRYLGTLCFHQIENHRFPDKDAAFTRACELIDEVANAR